MFLLLKLWTEGAAYHRGQKSMKSATEAFQGLTAKTMNRFVTLCALTRLQHLTPSQHRPPPPGHDRKHAAAVWQGRHSRSSENLHSGREAVWHLRKYRAQGGRRLYDRQLCHHQGCQAGQACWQMWLHLDFWVLTLCPTCCPGVTSSLKVQISCSFL